MRYYCGEKDIYTEDDLECGMKYTDAPGVKLEDIMGPFKRNGKKDP